MEQLSSLTLIIALFLLSSCGVKGRPLPPLTPPPLGRGEPTFAEATKKKNTGKTNRDLESEEQTPYPEGER